MFQNIIHNKRVQICSVSFLIALALVLSEITYFIISGETPKRHSGEWHYYAFMLIGLSIFLSFFFAWMQMESNDVDSMHKYDPRKGKPATLNKKEASVNIKKSTFGPRNFSRKNLGLK